MQLEGRVVNIVQKYKSLQRILVVEIGQRMHLRNTLIIKSAKFKYKLIF